MKAVRARSMTICDAFLRSKLTMKSAMAWAGLIAAALAAVCCACAATGQPGSGDARPPPTRPMNSLRLMVASKTELPRDFAAAAPHRRQHDHHQDQHCCDDEAEADRPRHEHRRIAFGHQ